MYFFFSHLNLVDSHMNIPRRDPYLRCNWHCSYVCLCQAWAFATGIRLVLGKVPYMNMSNFDHHIWHLHRKLFHRYVKYQKYFRQATERLPSIQAAIREDKGRSSKEYKSAHVPTPPPTQSVTTSVISLVSSSSDEVSEDGEDDEKDTATEVNAMFEDSETQDEEDDQDDDVLDENDDEDNDDEDNG